MNRFHSPRLILVAALGVLAMLALPAVAAAKHRDRNHDGIPDRWEKRHHLSLKVNQAHRNQDHEGLNNLEEFEHGTNPQKADTDGDGLTDSQEVEVGDDPRSADSNHDGTPDGQENAGKVATFDGTTLTIELFDGSMLSGMVTESTEIECDHSGGEVQTADDSQGEGEGTSGDAGQASDEEEEKPDDQEQAGEASCGTASLAPGAPIREAELEVGPEGAVFHSIHLAS
jgi:hypothetical protein